jgi:hypothetical protein
LLYRVLKRLNGYELQFAVQNSQFVIKDNEQMFALPIFSVEPQNTPSIETLKFDYNFSIDKGEFYKMLSSATILANEISLECNGTLKFSVDNHNGKWEKVMKVKSDNKNKKDVKAQFSIELLKKIIERASYGTVNCKVSDKAILLSEPNLRVVIASCVSESYGEDIEEDFSEEENEE